jgi:predicted ferric reductase
MDILVPLLSAYRPVSVGLGILALYLIVLLNVSFYLQNRIGHRAWRAIHYASFAVYSLATKHGIPAGNGTDQLWMQAIYATSLALVLAATAYRFVQHPAVDQEARPSSAARG